MSSVSTGQYINAFLFLFAELEQSEAVSGTAGQNTEEKHKGA